LNITGKYALSNLLNRVRFIIRGIHKVTLSSPPCIWASFHLSHLNPSFSDIGEIKKFLLNLGMKCRNSAFNAQGSRGFVMAVQVGAVKIYDANSVGAQDKRQTG
jgi:hypothetical protein